MGYGASVRPWLAAIGRHLWLTVGGVAASAFGTIMLLGRVDLPVIPPIAYFALGVALIFLASFRAFHDEHVEALRLANQAHARTVRGMLDLEPDMRFEQYSISQVEMQPFARFINRSPTLALEFTVFRIALEIDPQGIIEHGGWGARSGTIPPGGNATVYGPSVTNVPGLHFPIRLILDYAYGIPLSDTRIHTSQTITAWCQLSKGTISITNHTRNDEPIHTEKRQPDGSWVPETPE
jgi:hypothetical protein